MITDSQLNGYSERLLNFVKDNSDSNYMTLSVIASIVRTDHMIKLFLSKLNLYDTVRVIYYTYFLHKGHKQDDIFILLDKIFIYTINDYDDKDTLNLECSECYGEGQFYCTECNGESDGDCDTCGGNGFEQCNICNGTGEQYSEKLYYIDNRIFYYVTLDSSILRFEDRPIENMEVLDEIKNNFYIKYKNLNVDVPANEIDSKYDTYNWETVAVVSNIEELTDSTGSALIKDFFD